MSSSQHQPFNDYGGWKARRTMQCTFYRTQLCPLSFKKLPVELSIKTENNKIPLTLMAMS